MQGKILYKIAALMPFFCRKPEFTIGIKLVSLFFIILNSLKIIHRVAFSQTINL